MKRGADRARGWGSLATLLQGQGWDRGTALNTPAPSARLAVTRLWWFGEGERL